MKIFTLGHSTRDWEDFLEILEGNKIHQLIDVRTIPKSRHNPQFNTDVMAKKLPKSKIHYLWMKGLGGLRKPKKPSINEAWKNASFRGYADYMQTTEFLENLKILMKEAAKRRTAIMCAEAVPWRCHRSLISDALIIRKIEVFHIIGPRNLQPHSLTPWARTKGEVVWYPAKQGSLLL